jgi:hypothetical protein
LARDKAAETETCRQPEESSARNNGHSGTLTSHFPPLAKGYSYVKTKQRKFR